MKKTQVVFISIILIIIYIICRYTYSSYQQYKDLENTISINNNLSRENSDLVKQMYAISDEHISSREIYKLTYEIFPKDDSKETYKMNIQITTDDVDIDKEKLYFLYSVNGKSYESEVVADSPNVYKQEIEISKDSEDIAIIQPIIIVKSEDGNIRSELKANIYIKNEKNSEDQHAN